jgi:hypothetical protein
MEEVAGIIRLAGKYQADALREYYVGIFKTAWPATLVLWDAREKEVRRVCWQGELHKGEDNDKDNDEEEDDQSYLPDPGKLCVIMH